MIRQNYLLANARKVKSVIKKGKIPPLQMIISSPPYFDLLNYNNNKDQIGYGQKNYDEYLNIICKVFQDCYDLSTPDATFWLVVDTFKKQKEVRLFPFDIVNKFKENGKKTWNLQDIIIWDKGKNLPWNNKGNFKNQHEYILFFTKGNNFKFNVDRIREILDLKKWWKTYPERYNPNGKAPSNVWNFTTPIRGWGDSKQNHLCPFPFPLVEKIISLCTDENDWILDPFSGSGSVLAIAYEMHRNSIGIDVNKEYKKIFDNEVKKGAEIYWRGRVKELLEAKSLFANFKKTNGQLRKLKVASSICTYLNKTNKHPFIYFTKDRLKNDIEIMVLQNGKIPSVDLMNKELQDLIKQAKVNPTITVVKDSVYAKKINEDATFKYKFDNFFSYTSQCKMQEVIKTPARFEYMYSDIAVKINK